jgi:hypothetical protein
MPYRLPTFNLTCKVWTFPAISGMPVPPVAAPRIAAQTCALVYGRRVNVASTGGTGIPGVPIIGMSLLLPALTDVRGQQDSVGPDLVEVPVGSGRYYGCLLVDDIGKGWPNEHRTAGLFAAVGSWIAPYP